MTKTIAAYSGGGLPAAIGIIRLSGPEALDILSKIFRPKGGKPASRPRHMYYGTLLDDDGAVLDICMACFFAAPASYTGQDMAEIYCHGSRAVVDRALAHAFVLGAVPAQAGEFTKLAFLAGKLDLTGAEAVADLIYATSALAAKTAAAQLQGRIGTVIKAIREAVSGVLAHYYAVCDYSDEDIDPFESQKAAEILSDAARRLDSLAQSFSQGQFITQGIPVAIIGRPNTGKSSLFNYLCGFDKAIVTDEEGTTRDVLDAVVTLDGVPVRLLDTAGIRRAGGKVEEIGIRRAKKAADESHACLCLIDGSAPCSLHDAESAVLALASPNPALVLTKADLWTEGQASQRLIELYSMLEDRTAAQFDHVFHVSAATGQGADELAGWLSTLMGQPPETVITSARQAALAASAAHDLALAAQSAQGGMTADAFLSDAERALATLGQITGETASADIASEIFSRFCVGK